MKEEAMCDTSKSREIVRDEKPNVPGRQVGITETEVENRCEDRYLKKISLRRELNPGPRSPSATPTSLFFDLPLVPF